MGRIIAVSGKGGTGKTTLSSLIISSILDNGGKSVLAVDADPNSTLADALGVKTEDTLSGICEDMLKEKENLPAGMTKDRYLEYKIQQSLVEREGLTLLTMGRPEGPGCYCYANNLLREIVKDLTGSYNFTVIDNEAGMEHLSRKTAREIDVLFIVSDFSIIGVRSAARIYNLATEMGIKLSKSFLIVNKAREKMSFLEKEIEKSGLTLIGSIPFTDEIENLNLQSKALSELPRESDVIKKVDEIVRKTIFQLNDTVNLK
jgi:CO dehydrogenase maturation factor